MRFIACDLTHAIWLFESLRLECCAKAIPLQGRCAHRTLRITKVIEGRPGTGGVQRALGARRAGALRGR